MKRKMVVIGISYILGLFFASFLSHDKLYIIPLAALPVYIAIMLLKRTQRRVLIVSALSLMIGAGIYAHYTKDNYFPVSSLDGTETSFMGRVEVLEEYDGEYAGYILDGSFRCGTKAKILCFTDNLDCRYGDIITVSGTFTKPESTYLYNSEEYYKGLSVFLEADYGCAYTLHRTDGYRLIRAISDYRERIQSRIYAVSGRTGGSLTAAMIFGDKSGLDERVENAFYHAGLGPMLALSGFHLILFNGICNVIGRRTRLQRMLQFGLTVLLTALFSIIAMWPVSVLRAGLMLILARGACIFFRRSDSLNALCIAAIVLTLIDPYLIHNVGFLLSVAGTFGVNSFAPWMTEKLPLYGYSGGIIKMALSAFFTTLCTVPICICFFPETSLLAPVSNVIFAPMCILIMFCGIIIFFCGGAAGISHICGYVIDAVSKLLTDCLLWIELNVPLSYPSGWEKLHTLAAFMSFIVCAVYFLTRKRLAVCAALSAAFTVMLTGYFICRNRFDEELRIHILGRKDEAVIAVTYGGRTDVFDLTGDRKNPDHLYKFLTAYGIESINSLYLDTASNYIASAYESKLYAFDTECVMSHEDIILCEEQRICSQLPFYTKACTVNANVYTADMRDGVLTVEAYGKRIAVCIDEDTAQPECDYLICGDREVDEKLVFSRYAAPDGIICSGENIEFTLYPDGKTYTRRLS